jgi:hypothetical protein
MNESLSIYVAINYITIHNSYTVTSRKEIYKIINKFKTDYPNHNVSQISSYLLMCEWASHNICYKLNILSENTKHVDLNCDNPWWLKLGYLIVGSFYY